MVEANTESKKSTPTSYLYRDKNYRNIYKKLFFIVT